MDIDRLLKNKIIDEKTKIFIFLTSQAVQRSNRAENALHKAEQIDGDVNTQKNNFFKK